MKHRRRKIAGAILLWILVFCGLFANSAVCANDTVADHWLTDAMTALVSDGSPEDHLIAVHEFPTWFWRHAPPDRAKDILMAQVLNLTYSWEIRRYAVMALGQVGKEGHAADIVPVLAQTLERSLRDWSVRQAAVEALGQLGGADPETALSPLGVALADSDDRVRLAAKQALVALAAQNHARLTSFLVALLADNDSLRAAAAAEALGEMKAIAAIRPLAAAALPRQMDDSGILRQTVLTTLGKIGAGDIAYVRPLLFEAFRAPDASLGLQRSALLAAAELARGGDLTIEQEIMAILRDPGASEEARELSAEALGVIGPAASELAIGELISALREDTSLYLRTSAARALGEIGPKATASVQPLLEAARAESDDGRTIVLRIAAIEALGRIVTTEQSEAINVLAATLSSSNSEIEGAAEGALALIGQHAPVAIYGVMLGMLTDPTAPRLQRAAARTIARMPMRPPSAVLEMLVRLAGQETDAAVQQDAAFTLGRIAPKAPDETVLALLNALGAANPQIQRAAAEAFAEFGQSTPTAAIPALIATLHRPSTTATDAELSDPSQESDTLVQLYAVRALGRVDNAPEDVIKTLISAIKTGASDDIRREAARSLGLVGFTLRETAVPALVSVLGDRDAAWLQREAAGAALGRLLRGDVAVSTQTVIAVLDQAHDSYSGRMRTRLWAQILAGNEADHQTLVRLLGRPNLRYHSGDGTTADQLRRHLVTLLGTYDALEPFPRLRSEAGEAVIAVVRHGNWPPNELKLLTQASERFSEDEFFAVSAVLQNKIDQTVSRKILRWGLIALAVHALVWSALLAAYPYSNTVQRAIFWDRWVRRVGGLGYISALLIWLPMFRRRMFRPFRQALTADAHLENFDPAIYFAGSQVRKGPSGRTQGLLEAVPRIAGQLVLEGESGLGKTMFLRQLVARSSKAIVFLPATRCTEGVFAAIHAKILHTARDGAFLKRLVQAGALDVVIDGLNEASPNVHAQVVAFAEENDGMNLLISTQPMEWQPPSQAERLFLEPLSQDQIISFLMSREAGLPSGATITGPAYRKACQMHVEKTLANDQHTERAALRSMSNPMDLTVVADMIAQGQEPDLLALRQQQYELMAEEYARLNNQRAFPLGAFAERTFEMRLNDRVHIDRHEFRNELARMFAHRMVVSRPDTTTGETAYEFRHDKIMDFFLYHAFTRDKAQRQTEFLKDARFRGVYLLLATHLPYEDAMSLRESLITYAVGSKDHSLSDEFIQVVRSRSMAAILFSDLVSSTVVQARIGDRAWSELMDRHDEVCRREVKRCGGQLVKFTGDGFLATFLAPTNAVASAQSIRDALTALGLQARFGVHTGEIERRDGDISGLGVVIAARIMERATSGQLLASDLTRQLMLGSPYGFEEFDECDLKGVPGRWRLFRVRPSKSPAGQGGQLH